MKTFYLPLLVMAVAAFASCTKESAGEGNGVPENDTEFFDFTTAKEVNVSVQYPVAYSAYVELYTRNPLTLDIFKNYVKNPALEPVAQGYTDADGRLKLSLRLPSADSELYAYAPGPAAPVLLGGAIDDSGEVTLTEADLIAPATRTTRAVADTDVYWKSWQDQTFSLPVIPDRSWDRTGRPSYLCESKIALDARMMEIIDHTIPAAGNVDIVQWQLSTIDISEDAHVRLYFVSNSSARKNALAYYTYTDKAPTKEEINRTATILFPNLSSGVLAAGEGAELKYFDGTTWSDTFPAGSKIGFVLLVDAWENEAVTATGKAFYSENQFNRYGIPSQNIQLASSPHMVTFTADGNFVLSFEDLPYYEAPSSPYNGDFRDNIFILTADPATALPEVDPGIEDPDKPTGMEVPSKGVLAFEDLWPYKGDYDMNDIVLKYKSTAYIDSNFDVDGITTEWTFCNNGGQYVNGFGIAYDFPESAVRSFKIEATGNVAVPGAEASGKNLQILLFNDAAAIPSGTVFTVTIKFNKGAIDSYFSMAKATAPFNPFITVRSKDERPDSTPRKEVHLTNYVPSPLALTFDSPYGDDLSDPAKGFYYTAATGYPFAIDLAGIDTFDFPAERQPVSDAYPRFKTWVESKGQEAKDWYIK